MTSLHTADRRQRSGFTLIELMVVMGIIGMMLLMVGPAFFKIAGGSKVSSAASQLKSTLALARQWAVSHRESTVVCFPNYTQAKKLGNEKLGWTAYAVFRAKDGSQISEWRYLPNGLFFAYPTGDYLTGSIFRWIIDASNIYYGYSQIPGLGAPDTYISGFRFDPNGSMSPNDLNNTLLDASVYIVEALLDGDKPKVVNPKALSARVRVRFLTGAAAVLDN